MIFSICNTCVSISDSKHIAKADIVCASASKIVRKEIGSKALLQIGMTIPVYVSTGKGKRFGLAYLTEFSDKLVVFRTNRLPYESKTRGPKLRIQKLGAP